MDHRDISGLICAIAGVPSAEAIAAASQLEAAFQAAQGDDFASARKHQGCGGVWNAPSKAIAEQEAVKTCKQAKAMAATCAVMESK